MKEKCVICGKTKSAWFAYLICEKKGCMKHFWYCKECSIKHYHSIRCPRHFLKEHREDVARYKKEVSK